MSAERDYKNTPASPLRPRYEYAPAEPDAEPIVSLVTPFFNTGAVFHETAESVFRQSLQQWEWIVVDDGSDCADSVSILREYALKDHRIRVIQTSGRQGPAAARNVGVRHACASYVAFLDSDDLLEPTALEKWLWFLESHRQYGMVKGFQAGFGAEEYIWREGFHSGPAILERNLIQTASMIRREIYEAAGGMDETIRGGMEDWDFWLRCADAGYWGGTIPEVLDWYRRRASHNDRWEDWDSSTRQAAFREALRRRYPRLFESGLPRTESSYDLPFAEISQKPWFDNLLRRRPGIQRVLLILPHLVLGGSDKFNIDLISQLLSTDAIEISIATTLPGAHQWRHRFEALTPDVFTLDTFLSLRDYPAFLAYLICSRRIDTVLISHSQLGYQLLPYLRSQCPWIRCLDYVHIEEPGWKSGGYPAYSVVYRPFLDQTIASSRYLKTWMIARGGDGNRISVVTTNIDAEEWKRNRFEGAGLREKWGVSHDIPAILFAGRLCDQKQPKMLAEVLLTLSERGFNFTTLIAGDGEEGPWLRQFIAQHELDQVRMLGSRSSEEIQELMSISDIFFLPSRHEGIALAIYEAMAMEAVVVGADVGGQSELVTPECGVLIAPDDQQSAAYTDALAFLLQNPDRRTAMAAAARNRITSHFRLDDMGRRMAEILSSRPEPYAFDMAAAMCAFIPGLAREIIEQRRTEAIADHLWNQARVPAAAPGNSVPAPPLLASGRKTLVRSLAILRPLLSGRQHSENRRYFFSALLHSESRRELMASFDRRFYCFADPGMPSFGPFPLLHYLFIGFREGRLPSPNFADANETFSSQVNPLLQKCLKAEN